jgi:hypothetical protein
MLEEAGYEVQVHIFNNIYLILIRMMFFYSQIFHTIGGKTTLSYRSVDYSRLLL